MEEDATAIAMMRIVFTLVTVLYLVGVTCANKSPQGKPVFYRQWSACKKGLEYAQVIKKSDRVSGERYNERKKPRGATKTYICLPCTLCASGVLELSPCSAKKDTVCSETECAVDGCILDQMVASCRLPGDPNKYPSIQAMMDPCDTTKLYTPDPKGLQTNLEKVGSLIVSPLPNERKSLDVTALSKTELAINARRAAIAEPDDTWETIATVSVFVILGLIVFAALLFAVYKFRGQNKKYTNEKCASSPSVPVVETTV